MSKRLNEKKQIKIYREEAQKEVRRQVKVIKKMIRPKPKLIPLFLWRAIISYILRIKI